MKATVTVVELPQYLEWTKRQKALIAQAQKQAQVQRKALQAATPEASTSGEEE